MSDVRDTFLHFVRVEATTGRRLHGVLHSHHEAYAVILEELDEYKGQVWLKPSERDAQPSITN